MRLYYVVLLAATALLTTSNALPEAAGVDNADVSKFTFTERPDVGRSLRTERNDNTSQRFLGKRHAKDEKDEEERAQVNWGKLTETALMKMKLQYWFQRGKSPTWVRAKLNIPEGAEETAHTFYKLYQDYVRNHNGYKFYRFSPKT
uniref:RxLR effector protein n=1 Tax=Phytophthora agathidicida TaxID=1642459 RepID=A0A7G4WI51_9STRA|nr:PaRXLR62 [Phytophthora agathidicida]